MKLFLIIPILFCLQDSIRVDTVNMKEQKMFFEQETVNEQADDINVKLDELIKKLEAKKDTIQWK